MAVIGPDDPPTNAVAYRRNNVTDPRDREANRFAAALLMPALLVDAVYRTPQDLPRCADWFPVSLGAMAVRVRELAR